MDEGRIDLSPLDPGRDPARLERMVQGVLARAGAPVPEPFSASLVGRGRVAFLAAAAIAALAWVPALAGRGSSAPAADPASRDPVATVAGWARDGAIPEGTDLYRVLGDRDGR